MKKRTNKKEEGRFGKQRNRCRITWKGPRRIRLRTMKKH